MSFQEKSTAAVLAALVVVYGWYAVTMARIAANEPVDEIVYQPLMLAVVVPLVILIVVAHVVIAAARPGEANAAEDERDRLITLHGERVGGWVVAVGALVGLALVMLELPSFWIAHVLLGALVLGELAEGSTKLVLYRRGV